MWHFQPKLKMNSIWGVFHKSASQYQPDLLLLITVVSFKLTPCSKIKPGKAPYGCWSLGAATESPGCDSQGFQEAGIHMIHTSDTCDLGRKHHMPPSPNLAVAPVCLTAGASPSTWTGSCFDPCLSPIATTPGVIIAAPITLKWGHNLSVLP